ncbi:glycosyltransferase [Chloroflexota bacterium]
MAIFSERTRTKRVTYDYLFKFEDLIAERFHADIIGQSKLKFYFLRALDMAGLNLCTFPLYPIRSRLERYSTILMCVAHPFEIPILETINYKDKKIILYIIDAWEPSLTRLSSLIEKYRIDIVLCGYLQAHEFLREKHKSVYWLPQGFDSSIYKDYQLEKRFTAMQAGRKHPGLHSFFLNYCKETDYIHHFIEGNIKLAEHINQSRFFGVTPLSLVNPDRAGSISPVTQRYYLGMACKAMLVGFKPQSEEFNLLFADDVRMIEYKNDEQLREELEYYLKRPDEYQKIVDRNYEFVQKNHSWENRLLRLQEILQKEGVLG